MVWKIFRNKSSREQAIDSDLKDSDLKLEKLPTLILEGIIDNLDYAGMVALSQASKTLYYAIKEWAKLRKPHYYSQLLEIAFLSRSAKQRKRVINKLYKDFNLFNSGVVLRKTSYGLPEPLGRENAIEKLKLQERKINFVRFYLIHNTFPAAWQHDDWFQNKLLDEIYYDSGALNQLSICCSLLASDQPLPVLRCHFDEEYNDAIGITHEHKTRVLSKILEKIDGSVYVNLSGADLHNVKLENLNLTNCNFTGTNLRNASLKGSDLSGSKLNYANLINANMQAKSLRGASFHGAKIVDIGNWDTTFNRFWHSKCDLPDNFGPIECNFTDKLWSLTKKAIWISIIPIALIRMIPAIPFIVTISYVLASIKEFHIISMYDVYYNVAFNLVIMSIQYANYLFQELTVPLYFSAKKLRDILANITRPLSFLFGKELTDDKIYDSIQKSKMAKIKFLVKRYLPKKGNLSLEQKKIYLYCKNSTVSELSEEVDEGFQMHLLSKLKNRFDIHPGDYDLSLSLCCSLLASNKELNLLRKCFDDSYHDGIVSQEHKTKVLDKLLSMLDGRAWVNLRGADLHGVNLENLNLQKCDFSYGTLQEGSVRFSDLRKGHWRFVDLRRLDFRGAKIKGTNFNGCILDCSVPGSDIGNIRYFHFWNILLEIFMPISLRCETSYSPDWDLTSAFCWILNLLIIGSIISFSPLLLVPFLVSVVGVSHVVSLGLAVGFSAIYFALVSFNKQILQVENNPLVNALRWVKEKGHYCIEKCSNLINYSYLKLLNIGRASLSVTNRGLLAIRRWFVTSHPQETQPLLNGNETQRPLQFSYGAISSSLPPTQWNSEYSENPGSSSEQTNPTIKPHSLDYVEVFVDPANPSQEQNTSGRAASPKPF